MHIRSPYLRLMRLHQPVGIWLLLWPCLWALMLARAPHLFFLWFALGAVVMRSAGCIINDMADRKIDILVERTRMRPLASGELSMKQAGLLLAFLLCIALGIAFILGKMAVLWGALALIPVSLYPFMKRISWWPQFFLGLTFNWGALMGFAAATGHLPPAAFALYIGSLFWTLGYDTIYAHQDKKDDALIGVKSTALRLGGKTKPVVAVFYALALGGWALSAQLAGGKASLWLIAAAMHLLWQVWAVKLDEPSSCRSVFKSNVWLGGLVMAAYYFA